VPGRNATATGGRATTPERGTFLAEDATVGCAPGVAADGATGTWTAGLAAQPGSTAGVCAQTGTARHRRGRRLRCRMSAERGVAAQGGKTTFATDAQSGTAGGLTADPDAAERAGHVRSGRTVQRRAFARDQPRLSARAECCAGPGTGTGEPAAGGESALAGQRGPRTQTGLAAASESPNPLATESAGGLTAQTATDLAGETGLVDSGHADSTAAVQGSPAAESGIHSGLLAYAGTCRTPDPTTGTGTETSAAPAAKVRAATDTALASQARTAVKAGATTKAGFAAQPGFATHTDTAAITRAETGLGAQAALSP
jgi:hypothetical protein